MLRLRVVSVVAQSSEHRYALEIQGAGYRYSSSAVGKEPSTPRNRLKPGDVLKGDHIRIMGI